MQSYTPFQISPTCYTPVQPRFPDLHPATALLVVPENLNTIVKSQCGSCPKTGEEFHMYRLVNRKVKQFLKKLIHFLFSSKPGTKHENLEGTRELSVKNQTTAWPVTQKHPSPSPFLLGFVLNDVFCRLTIIF